MTMREVEREAVKSGMQIDTRDNIITHGRVVAHEEEAASYRRMTIFAPDAAKSARAGQFVHVLPRDSSSFDPLLRRAFSIMRVEGECVVVLYRIEGRGTRLLSQKRVGETVDFLGPLGQTFASPLADVLMVGGGVGVPPLVMLARQIRAMPENRTVGMMIGARTGSDVLCVNDFQECHVGVEVATDDGSTGERGQVTQLLQRHLSAYSRGKKLENGDEFLGDLTVYSCGPWAMLRAVAQLCARFQVRCQVSLEENMPCGIGVCNGCVVPVAQADDEYSIYRRICVDGPVMWAHEIKW